MGAFSSLRIAMIGTRGVPANYGGFETCVEEIGARLADKGHSVTVYCRESYYREKLSGYKGMKLVYLPNLKQKALDTLSHTFLSMLHASFRRYDVYMVFNAANSPTVIIPRLLGKKVAINTDGLEWKRGKWGSFAKKYYLFSEWLSARIANRIVADSPGIETYYRERYGTGSAVIAYGAEVTQSRNPGLLRQFGLKPQEYFLQITRFEPENNPLLTLQAFKRLKTDKKLVLVGGVRYESDYIKQMEKERVPGVIMPGYIYDQDILNELWCNCYTYIHGNEVGGTNPALLQTMAAGCFAIAVNVPFNHDVLLDCGIYFDKTPENLAEKMAWALAHAGTLGPYKEKARERIRQSYSWDLVADQYEELFVELAGGKKAGNGKKVSK
jgi:glycosyltransferase involved in cell wall biosynthesis